MERRPFLKGAGVVTVLVVGGVVWRAYDEGVFSVGQGPAYEPWKDWKEHSGGNFNASASRNSGGESAQHAALALQSDKFVD